MNTPFSRRDVLRLLAASTALALLPVPAAPAPALDVFTQHYPVLFVTSDNPTALLLRHVLRRAHLHATRAHDAASALQIATTRRVSLILCDANLSGMCGISLLQTLRAQDNLTPLILMSANSTPGVVDAAAEAGAADFFPGPLCIQSLAARIESLLEQRMAQVTATPGWQHTPPVERFQLI